MTTRCGRVGPRTRLGDDGRARINTGKADCMKLILSRKGFDDGTGECASPIFPDLSLLSLPIPIDGAAHRMRDATRRNSNFDHGDVVADLSGRYDKTASVHLDPLLTPWKEPVSPRWRPAFGQDGSAQGHLLKEKVTKDDLFLFFGWFRQVEHVDGKWRYKPGSPNLHVLFGWLQVARILRLRNRCRQGSRGWLADHPHVRHSVDMGGQNTLYVASKRLRVHGQDLGVDGGGTFVRFNDRLQLTAPHQRNRSAWRLPPWFHPEAHLPPDHPRNLSYHRNDPSRWQLDSVDSSWTQLRSVAKGQEFVIDIGDGRIDDGRCGPATKWLHSLFAVPEPGHAADREC